MELSKKTDYQLIKIIKAKNSSEAYLELKRRNERCYYRTCEIYTKKVPQLKYLDLIEDVDLVLNKAINTFKIEKKTKVSSWITSHSRYHVLNSIKKINELGHFIPTENSELDLLNNAYNKVHLDREEDLKDHVFALLKTYPDKRAIKIFELRYYSDKQSQKWHNIAKEMNLSVQQTMNIYNAAKKLLYKNMTQENNKK
jgi:DNA-directed RNA polymerase specialized sigma24 family protein